MPEIHSKTLHSFSSEDAQFPAKNLLETKVTKKWKCSEAGEKSCFVVLKLDQPRIISGIDIGNERSGFIEVLVGNSMQNPPEFKEILLATSFMTIIEAKNGNNPNRVRCFTHNILVESVAKLKWDLIKVICTQPFNNKIQYGLSFITLHTPEEVKSNDSPVKSSFVVKPTKVEDSNEKKSKFGKFTMRADSDSEEDRKKSKDLASPFDRWKSSKSGSQESKVSIKDQMKAKIEENRRRIRVVPDSSDDEAPKKPTPKPNRNRSTGLVYEDEDDEPNERLQKKLDKDKERREKEQKTSKLPDKRDKSPPKSEFKKSKYSSFIDDELPSTSSRDRSPSRSSKPSFSSSSSSKKSPKKSPRRDSEADKKPSREEREKDKKTVPITPKNISYKPFHKLLEGVVFAFSGYVNPERGNLRQKATDMGAKYRPDWDSSCTHLICAFVSTPKYQQVKGKGKIVTKRWIDACFSEKKRLSWRRFALDDDAKEEPESEDEIHNVLSKKSSSPRRSPPKRKRSESESDDDDMLVIDKRVKNGSEKKTDEDNVVVVLNDESEKEINALSQNFIDVSTDDEIMSISNGSTQAENQLYKDKSFYLNVDLPATDIIKLKNQISAMMGKVTERSSKADFIITETGRRLPKDVPGEVLTKIWVYECYELGALIPTTRYKPKN